jgi:competence protein ComEC
VGQGDATFIITPGGEQILVDGGPEFGGAARALSQRLPPWDRSLDLVALTHLDADHSRGLLRVLESYKTGAVIAGRPDLDSHLYPQWHKAVQQGGHRLAHLSAGQELALEEGVTLTALHPPSVPRRGPAWDSNNNSLVLRLSYGEISFLLTGDIEEEAERYLARAARSLQSDVLKVGHHGSNSSTTAAFLRAVKPRWAVISAGEGNQYGHPHPSVVGRLEEAVGESNVFSTATQGDIRFTTDGQRLWVETER